MLLVETKPGDSAIHGTGLFSINSIPVGTKLWAFNPLVDKKISPLKATPEEIHFGYVSNVDGMLVKCGDLAKWWNFGVKSCNSDESDLVLNGEPVIVASRDILAGEELLISIASDADAKRKLLVE